MESAVTVDMLAEVVDNGSVDTPDVTGEEVAKTVRKLWNSKAVGEDRIAAEILKNVGEAVIDWLTELMQEVWRTRQVPPEWRNAT